MVPTYKRSFTGYIEDWSFDKTNVFNNSKLKKTELTLQTNRKNYVVKTKIEKNKTRTEKNSKPQNLCKNHMF